LALWDGSSSNGKQLQLPPIPDKTAVVTFDDAKTAVPALISATTNAGYPSALKS
jgi:hypothetical protein